MDTDNRLSLDEYRNLLIQESPGFAEANEVERRCKISTSRVRVTLKALRELMGVKQYELADKLQMTQPTVSRMEKGDGDMGFFTIFRYAWALGFQPSITFVPTPDALGSSEELKKALAAIDKIAATQTGKIDQMYSVTDEGEVIVQSGGDHTDPLADIAAAMAQSTGAKFSHYAKLLSARLPDTSLGRSSAQPDNKASDLEVAP